MALYKVTKKQSGGSEPIIIEDQIPRMTSDNAPKGVASASYTYSGRNAYSGFSTYEYVGTWHAEEFWYNDSRTGQEYLQYEFEQLVSIKYIRLSCGVSGDDVLKFQSSIDGINFTDICFADVATANSMFEVDLGSFIAMKYFRILYLTTSIGYLQSIRAIGYKGNSPIPSAVKFKTWAHFDGTHALALDINIQASYDHKVTFEWYDAVQDEDEYRFSVYCGSRLLCRRRGSNYWIGPGNGSTQTWAGNIGETHLMINNDEEHKNYIDGNYTGDVTSFNQSSSVASNQYWIGGQYSTGSSHAYVKQFKIESISTGDVICNLVPCLYDNTVHCLYDTVSKRFYYCDGLQVMDEIPTT